MAECSLTLVLGGSRSGKSSWAERLAKQSGGSVLYIATAEVLDGEMAARVRRHRMRRPAGWRTVEAPLQVAETLETVPDDGEVVLIDCLTLFVSNWLLKLAKHLEGEALVDGVIAQLDRLMEAMHHTKAHVIVVSNEVGFGIVPTASLGRTFRDAAGLANQRLAAKADHVYLTIAGIPVDVKTLDVRR